MTIGEFFGTLQQSVTATWRKHLQTGKYSKHMALDEYYTEMPEKVDALIEAWQSENDVVEDYTNLLDAKEYDAIEYLTELKKIVKEGRSLLGSSELESLCDDCLSQISSTLYKLKHLKESLDLVNFLSESILNGAADNAVDAAVGEQELLDLIGKINYKSRRSLRNKVDSWGQPVEVGDFVLGCVGNNLTVCRVVEPYRNGMMVQSGWQYTNHPLDLKRGFIKIDPKLLTQIFPV